MRKCVIVVVCFFAVTAAGTAVIVPELAEELDTVEDDTVVSVLVQVDPGANSSNISVVDAAESVKDYDSFDIVFLELPAGDVYNMSDDDAVTRIEPDYEVKGMLDGSAAQIQTGGAQANDMTGKGVSVAVLDSGVADHSHLSIVERQDFTGEGTGDLRGHGTHVAGIIGSTHPRYRGIAPGADLYDVKVLEHDGTGTGAQLLSGLDYTIRNSIDVAVLSLGSILNQCNGKDALSRSANVAVRSGLTVVVAAGNEGPANTTLSSPGCAERPITVGAVDRTDTIAPYSSRGYTADGRVKPDVVAPGTDIVSTSRTGNFVTKSGTSMATPHVGGQAALLLEQHPDTTPRTVKQRITTTSTDLGYPSSIQGAGRVDVSASLNMSTVGQMEHRQSIFQRFLAWLLALFS